MSWEEEFNTAMAAFGSDIVPESIEYRLHYDDSGKIVMCSHQNHPDNVQYLIVDQETYTNYTKYSVDVEKKKLKNRQTSITIVRMKILFHFNFQKRL